MLKIIYSYVRMTVLWHRKFLFYCRFCCELFDLTLFVNCSNISIGFSIENCSTLLLLRIDFDQTIAQQFWFGFVLFGTTLTIHTIVVRLLFIFFLLSLIEPQANYKYDDNCRYSCIFTRFRFH